MDDIKVSTTAFSQKLKELRQEREYSQKQVADKLGL